MKDNVNNLTNKLTDYLSEKDEIKREEFLKEHGKICFNDFEALVTFLIELESIRPLHAGKLSPWYRFNKRFAILSDDVPTLVSEDLAASFASNVGLPEFRPQSKKLRDQLAGVKAPVPPVPEEEDDYVI